MQEEGEFRLYTTDCQGFISYSPYYDGCRYLRLSLFAADFDALFYEALGCPRSEVYAEGTDVHHHWERQRKKFQATIADLPQLARLWYVWEQVHYKSRDVSLLLEECGRVEARVVNAGALRFIQTLRAGCEEAQQTQEDLIVGSW